MKAYLVMDRYIGGLLFTAIAVVLIAFIGIQSVFALVEELAENKAGYGLGQALYFILLTTPRRIYELMPFVVFMGALTGLSILSSRSELTIFRTSGVSVNRLLLSVLVPVVFLLVGSALIGEYLAPWGEESGEIYKAKYLKAESVQTETERSTQSKSVDLSDYHWYKQSGLFMRAKALDEQGNMVSIKQYFVDARYKLQWIRTAQSAQYLGESRWQLNKVVETRFAENLIEVEQIDELVWESEADPRQFGARVLVEPRKLSISDLIYQVAYMRREGLNATQYQLALWGKIFQPLSIIALTYLAVGFILGPLKTWGMGARLSSGLGVGLIFKYSQDLFGPLSVLYAMPPWFAVLFPILLTGLVAFYGIRRVQ